MGISFGSINTGLPKDIVQQLVAAEKIPITQMEGRKTKVEDKRKLVNELIKLVEGMRNDLSKNANATSFRELKVITNNELVDVVLDKNIAQPGTHRLEIEQLAQKSSALTSGFEDKDNSYIGVGYIQYTLPDGETRELYIDPENASLQGVANLINKNPQSGLRAAVINDGSGSDEPWRMLITLDKTGDDNRAEFPYFYFVDGEQDLYLEEEREAHDAVIKVDGFEVEVPDNVLKTLIPGATVEMKKARPGDEFSITITENKEAVTQKVKEIQDKINGVFAFIKQQNSLDDKSDTSRTLGGDSLLQSLESRLRAVVFRDIRTQYGVYRVGDVGITFQKDGLLKFEEEKFNALASQNYGVVSEIFTGSTDADGKRSPGYLENIQTVVTQVLRSPDGLLQSRKKNLDGNIEQIDRRIADKQRLIDQRERTLKDKFARLEQTISQIKSQGAGLAAMGQGMASPVAQLG
ncbi:MAG: flagellar filament capping protein FliD [Pseudomonadota bacterium]